MKNYRIEAAILAVGLALAGLFVYCGFKAFSQRDRVVSVRGLSEREVNADHVIWPITYKMTGNDLQSLYAQINQAKVTITNFLTQNGIRKEDVTASAPQIVDLKADRYADPGRIQERYNVTLTITVSTDQVEKARSLMTRTGELLKQGIAISASDYGTNVQYEFNGLNKIKPAMIEEATKNAREAARKFAADSERTRQDQAGIAGTLLHRQSRRIHSIHQARARCDLCGILFGVIGNHKYRNNSDHICWPPLS